LLFTQSREVAKDKKQQQYSLNSKKTAQCLCESGSGMLQPHELSLPQ